MCVRYTFHRSDEALAAIAAALARKLAPLPDWPVGSFAAGAQLRGSQKSEFLSDVLRLRPILDLVRPSNQSLLRSKRCLTECGKVC